MKGYFFIRFCGTQVEVKHNLWRETKQYYIMTDDSTSRDTFNTPSFPSISDYDGLEQNTDSHNTLETNLNVSACITFIISLRSWIHAVENNRSNFDDLELQLIVKVKVKMLYENLKTPIWHFDDDWGHEVIYLICFWGDEFEILQQITSIY